MTTQQPPQPKARRTFFSRRFAPLIVTWIVAIGVAALIYWFETAMPAFHEVLLPIYAIVATLAVFFTWRWVRTRGKGERRHRERRHTDRRETSDQPTLPREY